MLLSCYFKDFAENFSPNSAEPFRQIQCSLGSITAKDSAKKQHYTELWHQMVLQNLLRSLRVCNAVSKTVPISGGGSQRDVSTCSTIHADLFQE